MQAKTPDMVLPFAEYFGYFILDEYHRQHRLIEQVRSGGKFMQVMHSRQDLLH